MKIIVTGSNGFIGKYTSNRLKEEYDIAGIDKKNSSLVSEIQYIQANIEDQSFVAEVKKKVNSCDVIIHLAAYIDKNNFNDKLIDVNCKGSLNIVRLAKDLGAKKIIHSSSLPVIGKPLFLPITESHKTEPATLYHVTKLMSEHIIHLSSQYDIKDINLRIPSPIGVGMNENTILPVWLKCCLKNEPINIYGNGLRKQNYIDVRDIAEAIAALVINDVEGVYNIASETAISNLDLAKLCIKTTGSSSDIVFNGKEDPEEDYCWETSIAKAVNVFSFKPRYTLINSIKDILDYWRKYSQ